MLYQVKMVLLGDTSNWPFFCVCVSTQDLTDVGKTALVQRFVHNFFSENVPSTVGASYFEKKMFVDGVGLSLQIWDTAGQERFRSLAPMYYHGAHAALLVYDSSSPASFSKLKEWATEIKNNAPDNIVICVAGTKTDLVPTAVECKEDLDILMYEAESFAKELGAYFSQTSSKANTGVEETFSQLAHGVVERHNLAPNETLVSLHQVRTPTCC
ncbi:rab family protein [Pelomyxa schiedti]|nr:rab family protein [Pelomyxa schiedti]